MIEALDGLDLDIRTGQRTTSVVARLTGARLGARVLLRADMDALPMHEETHEGSSRDGQGGVAHHTGEAVCSARRA